MVIPGWLSVDIDEVIDKVGETLLLRLKDGRAFWIPCSHVTGHASLHVGDRNLHVDLSRWICQQKGV